MPCAGFSPELYDLYALGVLEHAEAAGIDDHLRINCPTCEEQIHESLDRTAALAVAVSPVSPPRALRARIVGSVSPARGGVWAFLHSAGLAWGMAATCLAVGASLAWYLAVPDVRVSQTHPVTVTRAPHAAAPSQPPPVPDRRVAELTQSAAEARSAAAALSASVAQQRQAVAQLEAELRAKDVQLAAQIANQKREMEAMQARSAAARPDGGDLLQGAQRQLAATEQRVEELTRQVQFYQAALQSRRGQAERNTQLISFLSSPALRVLELKATEAGGAASGRALLASNSPLVFYASKLPALPAGRTYQLWLMRSRGRAVTSGGIFQPDPRQRALLTVANASNAADITALAVTEEPAGGQPLPTGHKILFGSAKS